MILTDKQAHILLVLLQDSLKHNVVDFFSFSIEDRGKLLDEILNQQSTSLIELHKEISDDK